MTDQAVNIEVQPLRVKLKSTVKHAGASRKEGESVWVKAARNGSAGYGEGCPRTYSAGDDLEPSVQWLQENFVNGKNTFSNFDEVISWAENNSDLIDKYPSAWCALEMALLDLFAIEKGCSVEKLLGLGPCGKRAKYTAVLGDSKKWKFTHLADQYLVRGFTDFKIKLNGNLERDISRLEILAELCAEHRVTKPRIRLDANNLWEDRPDEAIAHIKALGKPIFAMEEPVGAKDAAGISTVCVATGIPAILDESLCSLADLAGFEKLPGKFIANIKISRVGGLTRALRLIERLKELDWPIIIGCHIGETSLLTRVGIIAASVAGENLIAHEGAYGDYLVEREPVDPVLKFGRHGILDLDNPYYLKTDQGLRVIPKENWDIGFGVHGRMPVEPDDGQPEILTLTMPDNYNIHYRVWGEQKGDDVVVILHGGMSHSGWQAPLANALRKLSDEISIMAIDRRGCGLNDKRGDFGSVDLVVEDVVRHVELLKKSFKRVHLAGWCQGCQFAAVAAARLDDKLSSLLLITPGLFWNERFRSVINVAERIILDLVSEFRLKPAREQAYVPIPMEATDFTFSEEWLDFIEKDKLKTTMITMKTVNIMDEIQELSWGAMLQIKIPVLAILADKDRIVDNVKFRQFLAHMFTEGCNNRLLSIDTCHAVQFEKPSELARELMAFIQNTGNTTS